MLPVICCAPTSTPAKDASSKQAKPIRPIIICPRLFRAQRVVTRPDSGPRTHKALRKDFTPTKCGKYRETNLWVNNAKGVAAEGHTAIVRVFWYRSTSRTRCLSFLVQVPRQSQREKRRRKRLRPSRWRSSYAARESPRRKLRNPPAAHHTDMRNREGIRAPNLATTPRDAPEPRPRRPAS